MATSTTFNTALSYVLFYIDSEISPTRIQNLIDNDLALGEAWVHDGQLVTSRYDDKDISMENIDLMLESVKDDITRLYKELNDYKDAYQALCEYRRNEGVSRLNSEATKCIHANIKVRVAIAKRIATLNKKMDFLLNDAYSYAHFLEKKLKFDI